MTELWTELFEDLNVKHVRRGGRRGVGVEEWEEEGETLQLLNAFG